MTWKAQNKPDNPKPSPPPPPPPKQPDTERIPARQDPDIGKRAPGIEPSQPWPKPGKGR